MKHLIKIFALVIFFSYSSGFAQVEEMAKEKIKEKPEKVYKAEDDKRVYVNDDKAMSIEKKATSKMAVYDNDKDGKISLEEASTAENKWFSENFETVDTNSDGFIDMTELKTKMEKKYKSKMKKDLDY